MKSKGKLQALSGLISLPILPWELWLLDQFRDLHPICLRHLIHDISYIALQLPALRRNGSP